MKKALEPSAAKVFNDNGDVTFDLTDEPAIEDYWNAYCALRDHADG